MAMLIAMQGLRAQTYSEWSNQELAKANTAQGTSLSQNEQLIFLYSNLARLDGAKFMRTYAAKYLTSNSPYVASLKRDLQQVKNRPMLQPEKNLCYAAALHAADMGSKGKTGHTSTDGTSFPQRVRKYYDGGYIAENCSYGKFDPLDIVMQLLIDEGITSLGHRKNLLNEIYVAMGTSIKPHSYYSINCVQDFGDKLTTPMPRNNNNSNNTHSQNNNQNNSLNQLNNRNNNRPQNDNRTNSRPNNNGDQGPTLPSNNSYTSSNEIENAFNYLNAIRKNPARYSQEMGVNLNGIKAMPELRWNHTLAKVAQEKAQDMVDRDYFAHVDPDGCGINIKINAAGYTLRNDWYDDASKNYFESLGVGSNISTGKSIIHLLINDGGADNDDAGHRRHLLGIDDFWSNCYDIGIGMAKGGQYGYYWCVIIAKHNF